MFRSTLEEKIKNIFGIKRIIFDAFELGKEQEAIFIDIDQIIDYTTEGRASFLVYGRLEICGRSDKLKYGWVHAKIELAKKTETESFIFSRNETPIKFSQNNNEFLKFTIDFIYRHTGSFNPISAKIEGINIQEE